MFGFIGAALFGVIYAGAQISDGNASRNLREKARASGSEGYFDVNGVRRHTATGRKYTREELHREMFPETLEEKNARLDREIHDRFDYKYFEVYNPNNMFISEVFLTEEEAQAYVDSIDKKYYDRKIYKTNKWMIEHLLKDKRCNLHFEEGELL